MLATIRLGFAVRVCGCPDLPSADVRPAARGPELSVSLAYLRDVLLYLMANGIHLYRLHSRLVPISPGDGRSDVRRRLADCRAQLRQIGDLLNEGDIRLSFHADSAAMLNSPDEDRAERASLYLETYAAFLDEVGSVDGVIVCHVGGVYGDKERSAERFAQRFALLAAHVRSRIALEHDDRRFAYADVHVIHEHTGIPIVFDTLHHRVLNPERVSTADALGHAVATWGGRTPKVHFCTARSEMRSQGSRIKVPTWTEHSDYANPFEFADLLEMLPAHQRLDVMLEARAGDLAVLKLRDDVARFSPELAPRIS